MNCPECGGELYKYHTGDYSCWECAEAFNKDLEVITYKELKERLNDSK